MEDKILNYYGSVTPDGKIKIPKEFEKQVAALFSGKDIEITIEKKRKKRSLDQNAFFHGPVIETAIKGFAAHGEILTLTEVKEFFKFRFLRVRKVDKESGELVYEYSKSTAKLKTHEFCLFLDNCLDFMAQYLEVQIPPTEAEKYQFPEYKKPDETREAYLQRIADQLQDIYTVDSLLLYFNQVLDWKSDDEIKQEFTKRRIEIEKYKAT